MAIRHDDNRGTRSDTTVFPLNVLVTGLALALAFVAIQSPFI